MEKSRTYIRTIISNFIKRSDVVEDLRRKWVLTPERLREVSPEERENLIDEYVFNKLVELDPTPSKAYLPWMIKQYTVNRERDLERYEILKDFYNLVKQNIIPSGKERDIFSYPTLESVIDAYNKYTTQKSKSQIEREEKMEGARLVEDDGKRVIYEIFNKKASQYYGYGTKWCISGIKYNLFNDYFYDIATSGDRLLTGQGKNPPNIFFVIMKDDNFRKKLEEKYKKYDLSKIVILYHKNSGYSVWEAKDTRLGSSIEPGVAPQLLKDLDITLA